MKKIIKVKDLIERLKEIDDNLLIFVNSKSNDNGLCPILDIEKSVSRVEIKIS